MSVSAPDENSMSQSAPLQWLAVFRVASCEYGFTDGVLDEHEDRIRSGIRAHIRDAKTYCTYRCDSIVHQFGRETAQSRVWLALAMIYQLALEETCPGSC